jgi:hypothetical protein
MTQQTDSDERFVVVVLYYYLVTFCFVDEFMLRMCNNYKAATPTLVVVVLRSEDIVNIIKRWVLDLRGGK